MYTWPPYVHRWRRSPFWRWRRAKRLRASKRPAARDGGFLATRLHTATGPHRVKLACESMLAPMEASRQKQLSLLLLLPPPLLPPPMLLPPSCRRRRRSAPCVEAEIQMTCGKAHRFPCFSKASHTHKHSTAQASTTYKVRTYILAHSTQQRLVYEDFVVIYERTTSPLQASLDLLDLATLSSSYLVCATYFYIVGRLLPTTITMYVCTTMYYYMLESNRSMYYHVAVIAAVKRQASPRAKLYMYIHFLIVQLLAASLTASKNTTASGSPLASSCYRGCFLSGGLALQLLL